MRPLRWIAVAAGAIVALAVLAAVVVYATIDTATIQRYAEAEIARLTGRQMTARGLKLEFWPRLAVVAQDVAISNPPGASRPDLAHARVVKGAVAIFPLIRSRAIVVEQVEIEGLDAALEASADGRGNWTLAPAGAGNAPSAAAEPKREGAPFRLAGTVAVVDAKLSWRPVGGGEPVPVAVPRLEVSPEVEGRYAWTGTVDLDGVRWTIDATTGDPVMFARERVPLDVDARVAGGGITLTVNGRAERRDTGLGFVADTALAWTKGSEWLARRAPRIAADEGKVSTRIEARERRVTLDGLAGSVAGSTFDGSLAVDMQGKVPKLEGRLHAEVVDLASGGREAPAAAPANAPATSPAAPPVSQLSKLDADVDFVIDKLQLPGAFEATALRGRVLVAGGKLAADPVDLDFGGGKVTGRVNADAATGRGRVVVDGRGIELARAAPRLQAGKYLSGGATTLSIDLQGPASTAAAFVAGSNGTIRADTGPLQVRGIALDAGGDAMTRIFDAVNPFRRVDPSTDVQCAVVRLSVANGVAHAERTIALETSRLTASASGTIDLRSGTLDLLVRPRARKIAALPSVELADVIRVTGPIRKPSFKLDTLGAAKTAVTIGSAVATGGWALLATPLLSAGEDKSPCATARAGGKVQAGSQASSSNAPGDPIAPILRGIFGR